MMEPNNHLTAIFQGSPNVAQVGPRSTDERPGSGFWDSAIISGFRDAFRRAPVSNSLVLASGLTAVLGLALTNIAQAADTAPSASLDASSHQVYVVMQPLETEQQSFERFQTEVATVAQANADVVEVAPFVAYANLMRIAESREICAMGEPEACAEITTRLQFRSNNPEYFQGAQEAIDTLRQLDATAMLNVVALYDRHFAFISGPEVAADGTSTPSFTGEVSALAGEMQDYQRELDFHARWGETLDVERPSLPDKKFDLDKLNAMVRASQEPTTEVPVVRTPRL